MPIDTDNAWAAGFLDGEGCFMSHFSARRLTVAVHAAQIHPLPLERLRDIYGGHMKAVSKPREYQRPHYIWTIQSAMALREILPLWIPYLTGKRAQAVKLLDLCHLVGPKSGGGSLRGQRPSHQPLNAEFRSLWSQELSAMKKESYA